MAKLLPVVDAWRCQSSGDCCRLPSHVSMTQAERRVLEAQRDKALRPLRFVYDAHPRMTRLVAQPCPFVTDDQRCNVYEHRPYNCRRFQCQRPEPSAEPFIEGGPMGCVNLFQRVIDSASVRDQYEVNQANAQSWALAHGWVETQ